MWAPEAQAPTRLPLAHPARPSAPAPAPDRRRQVAATFFAGAAGYVVAGFTAYQLWLICSGAGGGGRGRGRWPARLTALREAVGGADRSQRARPGLPGHIPVRDSFLTLPQA